MGSKGGVELTSLEYMPKELLVETYEKAIDYKLDPRFIKLLENELSRRGIEIDKANKVLIKSM